MFVMWYFLSAKEKFELFELSLVDFPGVKEVNASRIYRRVAEQIRKLHDVAGYLIIAPRE